MTSIGSRLTLFSILLIFVDEQGVLAQTKKDKVLLLVRLRRERRKEWYVKSLLYMLVVLVV